MLVVWQIQVVNLNINTSVNVIDNLTKNKTIGNNTNRWWLCCGGVLRMIAPFIFFSLSINVNVSVNVNQLWLVMLFLLRILLFASYNLAHPGRTPTTGGPPLGGGTYFGG